MKKIVFFGALSLIIACQNKSTEALSKSANAYLDQKFDEALMRNPEFASSLGIKYGWGDWSDRSQEFTIKELEIRKKIVDTLMAMDTAKMDADTKLSIKLYAEEVRLMEEGLKWDDHVYKQTQMGGVVTDLPAFLINVHTIDSLSDAKAYVSRLAKFEKPFDQTIENLNRSQSKGIAPPQFTFQYVTNDIQSFIKQFSNENDNVLIHDLRSKLEKTTIDSSAKVAIISEAKLAIKQHVIPAYQKMLNFWTGYEKMAKTNAGAWSLPNGHEYYKYCLNYNTTLPLTADEVYETGIKEVARIHDEMRKIMKQVEFKSDSLQEFFHFVRTDKQFQYSNDDAGRKKLLDDANRYINGTKGKLSQLFNVAPKADVVVMAVEKFREKSVGGAFYENPTLDGKRPGRYYVNLYNMADEPVYQMEALTAHEAIPGHHMQIAIAQELTKIPKFRRNGGNTAYIEGWALYAEKLNKEMGFYQDPYSDFGRLSMEIFRAARLVVDVGIHQKKWSKQQAIDYFMNNTANAPGDVFKEIERYFLWPGQATGYKIGMLKIMELRTKAQGIMGSSFDIRGFHDVVLKNGSVPLNVLDELVTDWANKNKK